MLQTDIERWSNLAVTEPPQWEKRARVIASFVRPTDTVLDLGAGQQILRHHIPKPCGYVPVDCVSKFPDTFVVDFNENFRLPEKSFNVIISAGFLEYMNDQNQFMNNLVNACEGKFFICSFYLQEPEPAGTHSANKPRTIFQCDAFLSKYTQGLVHVATITRQPIFVGTLSKNPDQITRLDPLNDLLERPKHRPWYRFK